MTKRAAPRRAAQLAGQVNDIGTGLQSKKGLVCLAGHGATVHAATVQDGALVGMGATILDGCTVRPCTRSIRWAGPAACRGPVGPVDPCVLKAQVVPLQQTMLGSQMAGLLWGLLFQPDFLYCAHLLQRAPVRSWSWYHWSQQTCSNSHCCGSASIHAKISILTADHASSKIACWRGPHFGSLSPGFLQQS